jgi:Domain of unknown function (DUF4202)
MSDRLATVLAAIDEVNARDPAREHDGDGREQAKALLYGRRMSATLDAYRPEAPEVLRIAARAQHIERWTIPRTSYPEGRIAYLTWRKDLQRHHADRTAALMAAAGYGDAEIARAGALLRKERLKSDPDVQTLEDVICLVFLAHEAPEFIAKHDDDKVRDILAKTARKMSPEGLEAAGRLTLDPRLSRLLAEALEHPPAGASGGETAP